MRLDRERFAERTPQEAPIALPDGSRPRVLLAEDSAAARILTGILLQRMGCDVDTVEHGEEAVERARTTRYDLILLDIEMPVMDGVAAAREIRALDVPDRTPIVALSAFLADIRKLGDGLESFDGALAKPACREQLRTAVADALADRGRRRNPAAEEAGAETLVDFRALDVVLGPLDPAQWRGLVDIAVREMRDLAASIGRARQEADLNQVRRGAHKLKGMASTFAAPNLAQLATSLEATADKGCPADVARQVEALMRCVEATANAVIARDEGEA